MYRATKEHRKTLNRTPVYPETLIVVMIAIEGLSFRYRNSPHYALCQVNLAIAPGEFLVVTGPSGCGKSTLALAIGGYLFRQYDGEAEGSVTVAGMDVRQRPIYDVAEVVGLVQQNPEAQFCTLTVRDEVAFGLENRCLPPTEIRERIAWALSIVGAERLSDRPLVALSGGEKQKVAVAAMMATRPQALVFDEPTSNLDPTATAELFQVIDRIRTDTHIAVVVIEHKVDYLLSFEPRLVAMDQGRIVYDGPLDTAHYPPPMPVPQPHPSHPDRGEPAVRVENLHVNYDGVRVLKGISLEIGQGEFVSVMGDNGSGKTTFLHSLLGLLKPSQGSVQVFGHDTRQTSVSRLAQQVGFVFQNPDHQIFADSVWEEAIFAPRNFGQLNGKVQSRVEDLLSRCGLAGRTDDHPYRLSYGEKRRLNLISVLSYAPRLILLDEVLIGQDPANASFLLNLLRERVEQGDTVVMVNHAPGMTWRYASRLVFFASGQVIVDAPVEDGFRQLALQGRDVYLPVRGRQP
jgi:energy-coupling factor transporter ATP-binding protein EcfA2